MKRNTNFHQELIAIGLSLIILALCLSGCTKRIYVPVENTTYVTDTLRQIEARVDSVVIRDSVAVIQHGDTVMITKFRDRYRYRNLTDTVYKATTDSIVKREPYPVEIVKEVPRKLSWWQTTLLWLGALTLLSVLTYLAYRVYKKAR